MQRSAGPWQLLHRLSRIVFLGLVLYLGWILVVVQPDLAKRLMLPPTPRFQGRYALHRDEVQRLLQAACGQGLKSLAGVKFIGCDEHEGLEAGIGEHLLRRGIAGGDCVPIGHLVPPFGARLGDGRQLHLWQGGQHRRVELAEAADTDQSDPQAISRSSGDAVGRRVSGHRQANAGGGRGRGGVVAALVQVAVNVAVASSPWLRGSVCAGPGGQQAG